MARKLAAFCVMCGQHADDGQLCALCRRILPWNDRYCDRCGQPLEIARPAGILCDPCQRRKPAFCKARAPLVYRFPVDSVLKAVKFRRQLWYVPAFAGLLADLLEEEFAEVDALVPVPLHGSRLITRGFNQAFEICRTLRRKTALPVLDSTIRTRATAAQTGLNATERRNNVQGAFAVRGEITARFPLIVDDVITTGETCSQLASVLRKCGAESVGAVAIARAYPAATGLNV